MRLEHPKNLILTGLGLLSLSIPLQAAKDLVDYSPFLPPGYAEKMKAIQDNKEQKIKKTEPVAPKPKPQLSFKGYFRLGGVWKFSIFDKNTGKTSWVTLDKKTESGLVLSNFDPETGFIEYSYNGQQGELELASPSSTGSRASTATASTRNNNSGNRSIPKRTTNPGSSQQTASRKPSTIAKAQNSSVRGNIPGLTNNASSGTKTSSSNTSSIAPSAPPSTPPPSVIPTLPANLAGLRNTSTATPTPTTNNNSLTFDAGTVTPDTTGNATPTNEQTNPTPASIAINNPPSNSVQPTDNRTITPRRPTLNLPPGIPPPPTVAPPSLPEFLNVGGPPPSPGN